MSTGMVKKLYLDSVVKPEMTVWFSIVFENSTKFFVEVMQDFNHPSHQREVKTISAADLEEHDINGVSMKKLVTARLNQFYGFK